MLEDKTTLPAEGSIYTMVRTLPGLTPGEGSSYILPYKVTLVNLPGFSLSFIVLLKDGERGSMSSYFR